MNDTTDPGNPDEALQLQEEEARLFSSRLAALHEIGVELATCASEDELCRRGVELGRERLGLDRCSIWLYEEAGLFMHGTFGTDEQGNTRDERDWRGERGIFTDKDSQGRLRPVTMFDVDVRDTDGRIVGRVTRCRAAVWDGERPIGLVSMDNLLRHRPLTESQSQILALYGRTLGHLIARRRAEEEARRFNERLTLLHEIGNDLSRIANFDDLCRRAVELGRGKLGFDRLAILFYDKKNDCLNGAFATDEHGALCDQRSMKGARLVGSTGWRVVKTKARLVALTDTELHAPRTGPESRAVVGRGMKSVAALWDGEEAIGYLSTDNLIQRHPITANDNQVLVLYAATLGHLFKRKWAEEERLRLDARIQQAQRLESLGALAGGVAHDFNNLLTGILGNADLVLMDLPPDLPARKCVQEIEKAAQRATDLARQMLACSGKGRFVVSEIRVNDVVQDMGRLLKASISKKALLECHLAGDLPPIQADAAQLRQVLMNLVANASEALGDRVGRLTIATGVMECGPEYFENAWQDAPCPPGQYVYLEVSDTGCGMDRETLNRIFDPFFSTKFTGRGLGLAAVLGIVRGHRGALKVHSEPGKGTRFRILFPAVETPAAPVDDRAPQAETWRGSGTVLLVDDEDTVRQVGARLLERSGFRVLTARDGGEAVDLFRKRSAEIACVVLDMTMPRMDGKETFYELRKIREDVRVILSSGYNAQDVERQFGGQGPAGFVQKPYQLASLLAKLREVLPAQTG